MRCSCVQAKRAHRLHRPCGDFEPMMPEQGQGDPLKPEPDAAAIGLRTIGERDVPRLAKMVEVVVEAHAGCRLAVAVDRYQHLVFQLLLPLAVRHEPAGTSEE